MSHVRAAKLAVILTGMARRPMVYQIGTSSSDAVPQRVPSKHFWQDFPYVSVELERGILGRGSLDRPCEGVQTGATPTGKNEMNTACTDP